jgi:putative membrane protein
MKKSRLLFLSLGLAAGITACNSGTDVTATTNTSQDSAGLNANMTTDNNNTTAGTTATNAKLPLTTQDSAFVMKAAMGGMTEVSAGNAAQQNAQHDRVKAYGAMMVRDHSSANQELMGLASGRGMTVPTTLPPDKQNHVAELQKMQGRAFDNHYMGMMVTDHKKTIADFEKQANGGNDPELKAWAAKMLPALKMHLDSATAINAAIK